MLSSDILHSVIHFILFIFDFFIFFFFIFVYIFHCCVGKMPLWFSSCALDLLASRSHATNLLQPIGAVYRQDLAIRKSALSMMNDKKHPSERPETSAELCKHPHRTTSMNILQSEADDG